MKEFRECYIYELVEKIIEDAKFYYETGATEKQNIPKYDFKLLPIRKRGEPNPAEEFAKSDKGWYGIHVVDAGFNDDKLLYVVNRYGGGFCNTCICNYYELRYKAYDSFVEMICETLLITKNECRRLVVRERLVK